jgi:hypothetical protein
VKDGYVRIEQRGKKWLTWASVPVAGIPNFFLFCALANKGLQPDDAA